MTSHRLSGARQTRGVIYVALAGWLVQTMITPATALNQKGVNMAQSVSLEVLSQLEGPVYTAERNQALENADALKAAEARVADPAWKVQIQAKILRGWAAERALYDQILAELDAVDVETERKTAVGLFRIWDIYALRAQKEYRERVLPLAWEAVLKFWAEWPTWKTVTFLHMISAVPVEESIEPVIAVLIRATDPFLRASAAQALAKLPREAVRARLAAVEAHHQGVLAGITDARGRFE
jgi:hypothetical protein